MRETKFIEQNKEKWKELEHLMQKGSADPDKLNNLFVQITDDLSFSRTFYKNRSVRVYLNGLAQKIFNSLYRTRKTEKRKLLRFWTDDLPRLVYESRKEFRLAFLIFMLALIIGVLSSAMEPDFVRQILGNDYVEMTLANIEKGDPMAVYKSDREFGMSLGIAANNLLVAFITFATGVLYAVGTVLMLIRNGIMVGAFQFFFVEKGLFWDSFLTIWMHGALEISSIVIAGAAGLTMGRGLIFPGTFSRVRAFSQSARRGLTIMLGIAPIFIVAAFIEGYLTRHTELPDIFRLLFILSSFGFILYYFVMYPVRKARKGFNTDLEQASLLPEQQSEIDYAEMKSVGKAFSDSFFLYKKYYKQLLTITALAAVFWCLLFFPFAPEGPEQMINLNGSFFYVLQDLDQFLAPYRFTPIVLINGICFGLTAYFASYFAASDAGSTVAKPASIFEVTKVIVATTGIAAIMVAPGGLTFILVVSILPIILVWMYTMVHEGLHVTNSISRSLGLISGGFWRIVGLFWVIVIIGVFSFNLVTTNVVFLALESVVINFQVEGLVKERMYTILLSFLAVWLLQNIFALLMLGIGLLYHTLLEIKDAQQLKEAIHQIGKKKTLKGIEWEGRH
jgi:uncharacterized membrane protein SpoIIM required for sporulation